MWYVMLPYNILRTMALKETLGGTDSVPGLIGFHSPYHLSLNSF